MEIERQVVLTDLLRDNFMLSRLHGDGSDIDTVVSVVGVRGVDVGSALSDVVAVLPCVRRLALTDGDLFHELIGVVDIERQGIDAVT